MAANKKSSSSTEAAGMFPEIAAILIKAVGEGYAQVINLDNYPESDYPALYLDACRKYGQDNVRICRILSPKVEQKVEFV